MSDRRTEFAQRLSKLGISIGAAGFEAAYTRVQAVSDRAGAISDVQLRSIVDEAVSGMEVLDEVAATYQ
jgi:hypothetical protein